MQHFAQISDPHLSSLEGVRPGELLSKRALGYLSWRRRRRFEHRPEVLAALQQDLDQFELDQVLVTGDLTHVGLPQEFRQALTWLENLGAPDHVAVIAGQPRRLSAEPLAGHLRALAGLHGIGCTSRPPGQPDGTVPQPADPGGHRLHRPVHGLSQTAFHGYRDGGPRTTGPPAGTA